MMRTEEHNNDTFSQLLRFIRTNDLEGLKHFEKEFPDHLAATINQVDHFLELFCETLIMGDVAMAIWFHARLLLKPWVLLNEKKLLWSACDRSVLIAQNGSVDNAPSKRAIVNWLNDTYPGLIKKYINDSYNNDGRTPLALAINQEDQLLIDWMFEHRARPTFVCIAAAVKKRGINLSRFSNVVVTSNHFFAKNTVDKEHKDTIFNLIFSLVINGITEEGNEKEFFIWKIELLLYLLKQKFKVDDPFLFTYLITSLRNISSNKKSRYIYDLLFSVLTHLDNPFPNWVFLMQDCRQLAVAYAGLKYNEHPRIPLPKLHNNALFNMVVNQVSPIRWSPESLNGYLTLEDNQIFEAFVAKVRGIPVTGNESYAELCEANKKLARRELDNTIYGALADRLTRNICTELRRSWLVNFESELRDHLLAILIDADCVTILAPRDCHDVLEIERVEKNNYVDPKALVVIVSELNKVIEAGQSLFSGNTLKRILAPYLFKPTSDMKQAIQYKITCRQDMVDSLTSANNRGDVDTFKRLSESHPTLFKSVISDDLDDKDTQLELAIKNALKVMPKAITSVDSITPSGNSRLELVRFLCRQDFSLKDSIREAVTTIVKRNEQSERETESVINAKAVLQVIISEAPFLYMQCALVDHHLPYLDCLSLLLNTPWEKWLIDLVNATKCDDNDFRLALSWAAGYGTIDTLQQLADIRPQSFKSCIRSNALPLETALKRNNVANTIWLVGNGMTLISSDEKDQVLRTLFLQDSVECLNILFSENCNLFSDFLREKLKYAIELNAVNAVKLLMGKGLDEPDIFMLAVMADAVDVLDYLKARVSQIQLIQFVNPIPNDRAGRSPLECAASVCAAGSMKWLLENGAELREYNNNQNLNRNLLHYITEAELDDDTKRFAALKIVHENLPNEFAKMVNGRCEPSPITFLFQNEEFTPLLFALLSNDDISASWLIEQGGTIAEQGLDHNTLIECCIYGGSKSLEWLRIHYWNYFQYQFNRCFDRLLYRAVHFKKLGSLEWLLRYNSNPEYICDTLLTSTGRGKAVELDDGELLLLRKYIPKTYHPLITKIHRELTHVDHLLIEAIRQLLTDINNELLNLDQKDYCKIFITKQTIEDCERLCVQYIELRYIDMQSHADAVDEMLDDANLSTQLWPEMKLLHLYFSQHENRLWIESIAKKLKIQLSGTETITELEEMIVLTVKLQQAEKRVGALAKPLSQAMIGCFDDIGSRVAPFNDARFMPTVNFKRELRHCALLLLARNNVTGIVLPGQSPPDGKKEYVSAVAIAHIVIKINDLIVSSNSTGLMISVSRLEAVIEPYLFSLKRKPENSCDDVNVTPDSKRYKHANQKMTLFVNDAASANDSDDDVDDKVMQFEKIRRLCD